MTFPRLSIARFVTIGIWIATVLLFSSSRPASAPLNSQSRNHWVDSVFESMTLDQKIGQLLMVAAYSNKDEKHYQNIDSLVSVYNIGGLIFMQGGPLRQAKLNNRYQSQAKIPLFISIDGEWGLAMRLDSTVSFPRQMTLGAIKDVTHIYDMGVEIARECKRIGIHINFAPVVDVNSNPANPVIGFRSFGESKEQVAVRGIAYMKGLQDNKVLACAKHFPGHGDAETDSHLDLPIINNSKRRMDEIELYPFKKLIKDSLASIMVAHIHVPAYDDEPNRPTTLSENVVTDLLKGKLDFDGLIFTDALNMKGISKYFKPGEVEVKALMAGNDVLLFPENVPVAIERIKEAIEAKQITEREIDKHVKKILYSKYWAGLNNYRSVELNNLYADLNTPKAQALRRQLYGEAVTVVSNKDDFLPIKVLDTIRFASVSLGAKGENYFQSTLSKYAKFDHFALSDYGTLSKYYDSIANSLSGYNVVVIGLHNMGHNRSKNYNLTPNALDFIQKLQSKTKVILAVFGNAYSLRNMENAPYIVCGYEDNDATQSVVPQVIFGALQANGRLPVTASAQIRLFKGETIASINRLRYSLPYMAGMNDFYLNKIDSIANRAIADGATPGCQILIAKDGQVVYQKNFGYLTYDHSEPVTNESLYDIASVTKVAATLQAIMFLQEKGMVKLDTAISAYIPELLGTNKEKLLIRDILVHQAGLQPFLEHWKRTMSLDRLLDTYYCNNPDDFFTTPVSSNLYVACFMLDSIWKWTVASKLVAKEGDTLCYPYKYSDIGFYLMKQVAENRLRQSLPDFLYQNLYRPLGLYNTGYLPLGKFPIQRIAPTELDKSFRGTTVRGTVHDQGAALLGGVAGHAGIFSNANDLAILFQMNLQKGVYGGNRYLQDNTIYQFKRRQYMNNRRGLGWDKPEFVGGGGASVYASSSTFGHTGFTGTCVWLDPRYNLLYIFLSNRTYPNAENKKLINMNIRTKIHDLAYLSILNFHEDGCVP